MTMTCYWFSGTGNSLHAARRLAEVFPGMRLQAITDRLVANPPELGGEVVGFVFPVYAYGPPPVIQRFIEAAAVGELGYTFVAVCPSSNIGLGEDDRPVWRGRCAACLGCINLCPRQAVQTGSLTKGRRRYRHRDVSLKDLMNRK